jgi:hypothetical protein
MGMDVIMSPVDGIAMQFAKHLRGHVVVDTIQPIARADVTYDGFHQLNLPHSSVVILRSFA